MRTLHVPALLLALAAACADGTPTAAVGPAPHPSLGGAGEGAEASENAHVDMRAERAAILAADAALAAAVAHHGILAGLVPQLTDDAFYLQLGQPLMRGREPVRAFLAANPASAAVRFGWKAIRADVSSDGTLGYTFGYGRATTTGAGGQPVTTPGGYAIAWRKGADGRWRVATFLRNNAQAGLAAPPAGFESPEYKHYRYFPNTDAAAERRALLDADAAFSALSVARGPAEAFATFAAPDAALLAGVFGPEAIRAAQSGAPPGTVASWHPADAEAAASGDFGYTVGTAEFRVPVEGATRVSYSKYLTVWKRQRTGEWKYVFDGGNGSPPPAP